MGNHKERFLIVKWSGYVIKKDLESDYLLGWSSVEIDTQELYHKMQLVES